MLRKIRIGIAAVMLLFCTLLFLDFTGTVHAYLGWVAKIQFIPAVLAVNAVVVLALVALTLVFGRVYCSVICPMGITQDVIAWFGKKAKKNRYSYSKGKTWLRVAMLVVFLVSLVAGFVSIAALLEPYSFFGRVASNLLAPVYAGANNLFALIAERVDSYAFYNKEVWIKGIATFVLTIVLFAVVVVLAWRNGRTYCNTICPVGTILGFLAKFSIFRPVLDKDKCVNCRLCERNCKAACIDIKSHTIDYSRCVTCMDCIEKCNKDAIKYKSRLGKKTAVETEPVKAATKSFAEKPAAVDRRKFLSVVAMASGTAMAADLHKSVDGGLAVIEDKVKPDRKTKLVPPGSQSLRHFSQHCTACQLCVSVCPNGVLRPSEDLEHFMQPEMGYEKGYCRPECVKCAEVCPNAAIKPITVEEKTSVQIGKAVWVRENCVPLTDGVECGNCARHCPSGAIQMVNSDANDPLSVKIPVINESKCIGCGACEYLCPARPFGAIYVEGYESHMAR